jgi:ethanolamine ammonia-lyase small subunit
MTTGPDHHLGDPAASDGAPQARGVLDLDLPDPTTDEARAVLGVRDPHDPRALAEMAAATTARLGVGRTGSRPTTSSLLLFQADHAVTQDAIHGRVREETLEDAGLFTVTTRVRDRDEYLLRPDLGRRLSDEGRDLIAQRCPRGRQVQVVVGDGLSPAAVEANLDRILPVIDQGVDAAGLSRGTPFFVEHARVGVMDDVNDVLDAEVVVLLIGERPGLAIADALSAYVAYRPGPGTTDADRDLLCMITDRGGVNPLEAGAYVVDLVQRMLTYQASGRRLQERERDGA